MGAPYEAMGVMSQWQANQAQLNSASRVRLEMLYGFSVLGCPTAQTLKCHYCGRTKQTHSHKQCDGCGAKKEYRAVPCEPVKVVYE